jgi:hypothetical protein
VPSCLSGKVLFLKMKGYCLNIAGYKISIISEDMGLELTPDERFKGSICPDNGADISISVHAGPFIMPDKAERVFHAPLVEEIDGAFVKKEDNFWSVYRDNEDLFIKTIFPYSASEKNAILRFSLANRSWDLYIDGAGESADPLEYPLDGLILYYLTAIHGDIMVHASGVDHSGNGYIFSGVSGKGKTTMARLWDKAGSRVIHDDRLIVRNIEGRYLMFNTPVYKNDSPSQSEISAIFLISHGKENMIIPVTGAQAVSLFLANCIQHNWNRELVEKLIGSVSALCTKVPVSLLRFKPDNEITELIISNEQQS